MLLYTGGGGSGGSIFLTVGNEFTGLGTLSARGGNSSSNAAGGGSGGKIGVTSITDTFVGLYEAYGGISPATFGDGGPGSIYLKTGEAEVINVNVKFKI